MWGPRERRGRLQGKAKFFAMRHRRGSGPCDIGHGPGVLRPRTVRYGEAIMAANLPACLSWRKHDGVLAIVLEGITGHFDITLYRLGHKTCRPIAEDSIEGSLADARQEADGLVRELLEHQCSRCSGWVTGVTHRQQKHHSPAEPGREAFSQTFCARGGVRSLREGRILPLSARRSPAAKGESS